VRWVTSAEGAISVDWRLAVFCRNRNSDRCAGRARFEAVASAEWLVTSGSNTVGGRSTAVVSGEWRVI
jgi:hypothetical protein